MSRHLAYVVCRAFTHKPTFCEELVIIPISYEDKVNKIQLRAVIKKFLLSHGANDVDVVHISPVSATLYQTIPYEDVAND